jgi:hypothetical protein
MMHGTSDVYDVMNKQDGIPSPWSSWKEERNSSPLHSLIRE